MSMIIKNNKSAINALNTLNKNSDAMAKSLQKVSTGMRINGAADDSSGYAISERMKVQLRSLEQDNRNAQNGISMLKVAEGAVSSTVEILKTLKEKAINAANDTNTDMDRVTIQKEVDQSLEQIDDNSLITFNGKYLLNGSMGGRMTGSASEVIVSFMAALDTTTLSGKDAVNDVIKTASGGVFSGEDDLIDSFISDLRNSGSSFLKDFCDIDLDNLDTGAITGADAGGEKVKTAESIVPEEGNPYGGAIPSGTSIINGLEVVWPDSAVYDADPSQKSAREAITKALSSQWMKNCLDLVDESYVMNFEESGATVKKIDVKFEDDSGSSTLAYVTSHFSGSQTTQLDLTINMHYYKSLHLDDPNGSTDDVTAGYLDRTLAHEMTHAVMSANISNFASLPKYLKEGTAELVHGIDDFRKYTIKNLVNNPDEAKSALTASESAPGDDAYVAGYMLLRYFAKQASSSDPTKAVALQVGTKANQAIMFGLADMRSTALNLKSTDGKTVSLITQKKASAAINVFDAAIEKALRQQTSIGALQNRLEFTQSNLTIASENVQSSESTFRDADMAKEMTEYTKNNVLLQAAQSILAQANQNSSNVLGLLQ